MRQASLSRRYIVRSVTHGLAGAWLVRAQETGGEQLRIGGSEIEVRFAGTVPDLDKSALLAWVRRSADAVARYFGRFPVSHARVLISVQDGRGGVSGGRTWGGGGAHTRVAVGQATTVSQLDRDWVMTHEFVHYGFPNVPDRHHWIEEGLATYVEPIARVAVGNMTAATAWFEMLRDMPQGLPREGDQGLDHTATWGRTYWGGALFCLLADLAIRKQTRNKKGFRDAVRGIVNAGGTIEVDWPVTQAFDAGDRAVGGSALRTLYEQLADRPSPVDLTALWKDLGVSRVGGTAVFDDSAPLAAIRRGIMT
jgi:hypothetical protein